MATVLESEPVSPFGENGAAVHRDGEDLPVAGGDIDHEPVDRSAEGWLALDRVHWDVVPHHAFGAQSIYRFHVAAVPMADEGCDGV
jgi:hypothetical protein